MTNPYDITALRAAFANLRAEVGKAVVGQDGAVTGLIVALLANGHVLLEGVPGVAKTLLVRTLRHRVARLRREGRSIRVSRRAGVHEHPARG